MTDTDDDLPFSDDHPSVPPTVIAWRATPPTPAEFKRWPYWWLRLPCGVEPELLQWQDGEPRVATDHGETFDPEDWPDAMYTPAVPPP